jgi:hypothetical protein
MCAGARATGSRARSGLRGDRDAVSLRGKTPRADPLARRDFPPLHVAPATVFVRPEHDPVSGLFNGLQGGKVSLQLPPESHTASRAPVYHILWVRVFRDHTISGRGFNLFKPLGRQFRANSVLPSGPVAPRSRRPKRLGSKDRRSARRSPPGRRCRNKYRTTARLWEEKTPGFRKRILMPSDRPSPL